MLCQAGKSKNHGSVIITRIYFIQTSLKSVKKRFNLKKL
jgi:hypothetical protein